MPNWADVGSGLKHAWDAFRGRDAPMQENYGAWSGSRPDRSRTYRGSERSIVTAIYNRIAIDVAALSFRHAYVDVNGKYIETIPSKLNEVLTVEANVDQTGRAFIQDLVYSMLDEGCVAAVPVRASVDPLEFASFDILKMRAGRVVSWYPEFVRIEAYDELTGRKEQMTLPKRAVGIIENPMYAIMNGPNSTLQRLIRKLNLLDAIDEQSGSGKLDLIIQLPNPVRSDVQKKQAEERRNEIERQLNGSKYGIAYTGATERIIQLNRSLENNLLKQIEFLTDMVYSQLGITAEVMNGTADEKTMLNYHNRTIEPIASAITDELNRKYLTKRARNEGQAVLFVRDPFRLTPVTDIANMADVFTRNEIMTSNELRGIIGLAPSDDPRADQLINSNNVSYGQEALPGSEAADQNGSEGFDPMNLEAPEGEEQLPEPTSSSRGLPSPIQFGEGLPSPFDFDGS